MNATQLVNEYYTWENNGSNPDDETVEVYAGRLIAKNNIVGALVICVQLGLNGDFNEGYFYSDVAKVIIAAANS